MDKPKMDGTFSLLPAEILELIYETCDLGSISALRLTCLELNKKTLRLFTKRYF